ncbi:MAG: hypothetical protein KDB23_21650, partial [Planctomycetales bacterium]|nr:hypothetical protein [Planctomycetales bacterium]
LRLVAAGVNLRSRDAFDLFEQLMALGPKNVDPAHAFYLGYELSKATTALTLGKQYTQDEALSWGLLTVAEPNRHDRAMEREKSARQQSPPE